MNHMHAWIVCKLSLQIARKRRVDLKQEQMRVWTHPSRDLARMDTLTRAIFRKHTRLAEIDLAGHAFNHRF